MDKNIYLYQPGVDMDYVLLHWLERMRHDGEIHKVVSKHNHTPSTFLALFGPPRQLFFKLDDLGNLALACWIEPCMGSVFLAYYAQPAYRKHREVAHFIFDCFDMVFTAGIPSLCGLIQERPTPEETSAFIKLHEKLGYTYRGNLPKFFDGKDCHLVAMTQEDWATDNAMKRRWRAHRQAGK